MPHYPATIFQIARHLKADQGDLQISGTCQQPSERHTMFVTRKIHRFDHLFQGTLRCLPDTTFPCTG